ncbi:hypothetical protein [Hyphomicrobium sp. DY-1]|uniref:hypothetical protein n=1 Tax=Hyphomicrobium sp. DY-1 TaxID=3075650 RepID=UPI0039C2A8D7
MAAKPIVKPEVRVPGLAESDPTYAALLDKREAISAEARAVADEKKALARDLEKNPPTTGNVSRAVAEALGEVAALDDRPKRLLELRQRGTVLDEAAAVLIKRIQDRRSAASRIVCDQIRPEFAARVKRLADALEAAHKARVGLEDLINDLEAQDVQWSVLGSFRAPFLGDIENGPVQRFIREAKEAKYV